MSDVMDQFKKEKIFKHKQLGNLCRIVHDEIEIMSEDGSKMIPGKMCVFSDRTMFAISFVSFKEHFEEYEAHVQRDYDTQE